MKKILATVIAAISLAAFAKYNQPTTRLDLSSQPSGAKVFVDGSECGVTPTTLFSITPGRHHVKFSMAGYVDSDCYVTVEAGRPAQHSDVLNPEKGILLLKSTPSACEITIDGFSVGMTPRLITNLDVKDVHRMTLSKAGYRSATFDIRFNGRSPLVRNETLIRDSGVLHIITEPAGAEVTLNGIVRGHTPVTVSDVPKGRATLKLSKEGFKDEIVSELVINAGDEQTISRMLEGHPGTLSLSSIPAGARFYVNGEYRGVGPLSIPSLKPGEYNVRAELEGHGSMTRIVTVGNGSTPSEEFRLSNVMGRLEVRTSPAGAQVIFDGQPMGITTTRDPDAEFSDVLTIDNVMEGEHTMVVRKEGYAEHTRHPKIRSHKTSQAKVRLRRIFKPDIEIVTDTGSHKGILVDNTPEYIIVEVKLGIQRSFPRADIRSIRFLDRDSK